MTPEIPVMEQEITKEQEPQLAPTPVQEPLQKPPQEPKNYFQNLKNLILHLKKPKPITVTILFVSLVLISIGLNLLSKKNAEETPNNSSTALTSPSPTQSADPNTQNVSARVKAYSTKLDKMDNFQKNLQKPIVDLDISFK